MTKKRTLLTFTGIAALVIATIAVIAYYKNDSTKTVSTKTKLPVVTLAMDWTPNTNHTGIYVAQQKGWYKNEGIDVQILPYSATVTATTIVANGKATVGIGSIEDIVGDYAKNKTVVSIGAIAQHNTSGFVVRADSDIYSPKDFDGKTYGAFGSPLEETVIKKVIKDAGGQGNFKSVMLNVQAMQMLESKKIDFVWVFEGWDVISAQRSGVPVKFFPVTDYGIPDSPTLAFIATRQRISDDASTLKRFMSATAKGYEYARTHPREAADLLISGTPRGTFSDTELIYESQTFLSKQYADTGRKWGVQDLTAWTQYPQFMLDSGILTNSSDEPVTTLPFEDLYTNQFLQ